MIKKYNEFVNEGFLARLTKEYVEDIERQENIEYIVDIDGVDNNHSFTDMNGKFHKHGYYIKYGNTTVLSKLIEKLIEIRGNKAKLNDIDVSNVIKMDYLFFYSEFNGNLSGWDVSNVINFHAMFSNSNFNNHSIDNWKLCAERGKEIDLGNMFFDAKSVSNIDFSKWNVKNVTNFNGMFDNTDFNGDLSGWDVSNGKDFHNMLSNSDFNNHSIDNWKLCAERGKEIDLSEMFIGRDNNNPKDCSNIDLSKWNVENVTNFFHMFLNTNFDCDLSKWDVGEVTNFHYIFGNCPIKDEHLPKGIDKNTR